MGYPTVDDVTKAASDYAAEIDEIGAFAAWHNRVPRNAGEVATFQGQVSAVSPTLPHDLTWDYIEAKLGLPSGVQNIIDWAVSNGYMHPDGSLTGNHPPSLFWYLKSTGQETAVTVPTGSSVPAGPALGGLQGLLDSVTQHPLIWGGGALFLVLIGTGVLGGRRR